MLEETLDPQAYVPQEETPAEAVVETPVEEIKDEAPAEEIPAEEEAPVEVEEAPAETPEPIVFDVAAPDFEEKVTEVLENYEVPPELQAVIEAYKAKATAPDSSFAEYSEYGDTEQVKALLDRQAHLDSVRETETGTYRPNTDKFVETLPPEKAQWMYFDLSRQPSQKYQGLNQFEETIADTLAVEGETVGDVLARYKQSIDALRSGVAIQSAVPDFIPAHLHEAYWQLSREEQEELNTFAPDADRVEYDDNGRAINIDAPIRARKLDTLSKIQKGIEGDKLLKQQEVNQAQTRQQTFHQDVMTAQVNFYDSLRESFTADLMKEVQFSSDPKLQTVLAHQNVALLTQAFSEDSDGVWARKALAEAGIQFDVTKAQALVKDVEQASVSLATAKQIKDANGNPINQVELNKAKAYFERAGKNWQNFAKDLLKQQADLTSTGTAKAVDKAATEKIEKKKMEIKARPSTKGTPSSVTKKSESNPHPYGSRQYDEWYADRMMDEAARRAAVYN